MKRLILFLLLIPVLVFGQDRLIIEEEDASPKVDRVWDIKVSNGTLTNNGGGSVSISTLTGGGVAGANTEIQYNSSGSFGASSGLTWDSSTAVLAVGGYVRISSGSAALPAFSFTSDTDSGLYRGGANSLGISVGNSMRMIINTTGIGIANGGITPSTVLDMQGADNSTVETIRINTTQANVTAADTFVDFRSTTGSEGSITGTAVAGVIAYNTFTGSHYTQIEDKANIEVGMLLEIIEGNPLFLKTPVMVESINDEGKTIRIIKEIGASNKLQLFKTKISDKKQSKAVVGVYGGSDNDGRDLVLAIGTGVILLANKGVDLEIGDFLISSDKKGYAEKQNDDIYRNSTVAKVTENVKWKLNETGRIVKCIYLGG